MANVVERAIAALSPAWAARRAHDRRILAYYEAASPGQTRKGRRETASANDAILRAGSSLRQQARHLEQNHDIALGVLNVLVANTVGATGITVEPQPRGTDGAIHADFAREMLDLYKDWCRRPEVTWQHDWPSAQRLLARTWYRDGEVFGQLVEGVSPWLDHGTKVPLSIEMLEPDFVPMEYQAMSPTIAQGIEVNAWGRPVGYWVHKQDPAGVMGLLTAGGLKRIESARMLHLANRHRIRQLRGVSVFASVLESTSSFSSSSGRPRTAYRSAVRSRTRATAWSRSSTSARASRTSSTHRRSSSTERSRVVGTSLTGPKWLNSRRVGVRSRIRSSEPRAASRSNSGGGVAGRRSPVSGVHTPAASPV